MDRRDFLKTAAAVPAAAVTPHGGAADQQPSAVPEASTIDRPGSDFMVDILKSIDFEYVFSNPANTFRGLHESIVNYGGKHQARVHHLYA
jgi:acetolactate synthase I/II/III large subunit